MQTRLRRLLVLIALTMSAGTVAAETIAVIGTGNVASALGPEFAAQGHTIVYGSRNPDSEKTRDLVTRTGNDATATTPAVAVKNADIVVLAVPGMLAAEITKGLGDLSEKIIIDPTNPMQYEQQVFSHAVATSNTRIIQDIAPGADVVKAFNTLGWMTMIDPGSTGGPVSIPLAGDSQAAKQVVAGLVENMGLDPIDMGNVDSAHWLEGMAILMLNNRFGGRDSFDYYLRKNE